MTDGTLTLEMLDAAIGEMRQSGRPSVSYDSLGYLALRMALEWDAGIAAGTLNPEDREAWAQVKFAALFGESVPQTERIPIPRPLEQTERERGKWKRRR